MTNLMVYLLFQHDDRSKKWHFVMLVPGNPELFSSAAAA